MVIKRNFKHDVAISFAGEDRRIAEEIAEALKNKGLSVFIDSDYKSALLGKDLSKEFKREFGGNTLFVLVLISNNYKNRDWTDFEFSIARAESNRRKVEFILPLRLDKTKLFGLRSGIGYLEFSKVGVNGVVDCIVEKVKNAKGELNPNVEFQSAYKEWRKGWPNKNFLPGYEKARYFLDNLGELTLNVSTCEFLIRSIKGFYDEDKEEKLKIIDKQLIFNAAIAILAKKENGYIREVAIKYLVFANPLQAESFLWNIYKDDKEDLSLRKESFGRLWKSKSKMGMNESYAIALKEKTWQLREAAIDNIGHGKIGKETDNLLKQALKDKRGEVRSAAAYAIVRLKIDRLAPALINAWENERSSKCARNILFCMSNFNSHPKMIDFVKLNKVPAWFHNTPNYRTFFKDKDTMDDML